MKILKKLNSETIILKILISSAFTVSYGSGLLFVPINNTVVCLMYSNIQKLELIEH